MIISWNREKQNIALKSEGFTCDWTLCLHCFQVVGTGDFKVCAEILEQFMLNVSCFTKYTLQPWQAPCTMEHVVQPRIQPKWMSFYAVSTFYFARYSFAPAKSAFIEEYNAQDFAKFATVSKYLVLNFKIKLTSQFSLLFKNKIKSLINQYIKNAALSDLANWFRSIDPQVSVNFYMQEYCSCTSFTSPIKFDLFTRENKFPESVLH